MRLSEEQINGSRNLYFTVEEFQFDPTSWGYIKVIRALHDTISALQVELTDSKAQVASAFEAAAGVITCHCNPGCEEGQLKRPAEILALTPRAADLNMKLKVARAVAEEALWWCERNSPIAGESARVEDAEDRVAQLEAELAQEVGDAKGL